MCHWGTVIKGGSDTMTAKEIFLELLKPDGRPERQLVQYEALEMVVAHPIGAYIRPGFRPGASITDRWGVRTDWPLDAPGAMPHVTQENKVIKDITHWRLLEHDTLEEAELAPILKGATLPTAAKLH